jgi:hypothetical protein
MRIMLLNRTRRCTTLVFVCAGVGVCMLTVCVCLRASVCVRCCRQSNLKCFIERAHTMALRVHIDCMLACAFFLLSTCLAHLDRKRMRVAHKAHRAAFEIALCAFHYMARAMPMQNAASAQ